MIMELVGTLIPTLPHEQLISMLNEQLHENEVNRIKGISNKDQAFRSATGSLLLAKMVCRISGYPVSSISIHRYSNGKPFLPDFPNLHFNISHTDNIAVLAINSRPIGIDIERVTPARMAIADRFFSKDEKEMLNQCPSESERDKLFFELWTARESFVKAIGIGIFSSMEQFAPQQNASGWQVTQEGTGQWNIRHYKFMSDYIVALCSKSPIFPEEIEQIEFKTLFD
jgi:4'-phosphopantetheinyl transferase